MQRLTVTVRRPENRHHANTGPIISHTVFVANKSSLLQKPCHLLLPCRVLLGSLAFLAYMVVCSRSLPSMTLMTSQARRSRRQMTSPSQRSLWILTSRSWRPAALRGCRCYNPRWHLCGASWGGKKRQSQWTRLAAAQELHRLHSRPVLHCNIDPELRVSNKRTQN